MKILFTVAVLLTVFLFVGCGSGDTAYYYESNDSNNTIVNVEEIAPLVPVIRPYGNGNIYSPYVVNQKGLYETNELETYYQTSLLEENCTVIIDSVDWDIHRVDMFNGNYTMLDYQFEKGKWKFNIKDTDYYTFEISSYKKDMFGFYATCWK